MLLHRGHGSILSGFFGVFSSEALVSLCSSFSGDFCSDVSVSAEGVLGFSSMSEAADFKSSVVWCDEAPSSSSEVSSFLSAS